MIKIQFKTNNSAFEQNPLEIYHILTELAEKLNINGKPGDDGKIYDTNGNNIGTWEYNKD